jgi:hypothetical protein
MQFCRKYFLKNNMQKENIIKIMGDSGVAAKVKKLASAQARQTWEERSEAI